MTAADYSEEALWLKAKLFLNHAMDEEPRTFDEQALWASLALELLAKAALARVSPLLIASPTEDGTNLLIASGLIEGEGRFTSVKAHTLYSRCHKAFRPFNDKEAQQITWARNEYLHGGSAAFAPIPPAAWWPRYWAQAVILVNAQDKTLEDLLGYGRSQDVEGYLAQNKRNLEHRVEMLIERAKQRLAQFRAGNLPARIAKEWANTADLAFGFSRSTSENCPACASIGVLEGQDIESSQVRSEEIVDGYYEAWVDLTVLSSHFSCETCRLVLDGMELVEAAGLPTTFADSGDYVDYMMDEEYGND
ncbi:hypothetical protein IW249_001587 [Micromonospora vinacea]|uniref:Uncharacterized protein n=1 Tax=Micromonospora vinacea TaxID=709878 RepID=A0ABS0JXS0_9ACTN|nr:hypothetical protein [Micromonospora vinacea]MBG6101173.1 hypothetical protein [Micromonospora vinacea]